MCSLPLTPRSILALNFGAPNEEMVVVQSISTASWWQSLSGNLATPAAVLVPRAALRYDHGAGEVLTMPVVEKWSTSDAAALTAAATTAACEHAFAPLAVVNSTMAAS